MPLYRQRLRIIYGSVAVIALSTLVSFAVPRGALSDAIAMVTLLGVLGLMLGFGTVALAPIMIKDASTRTIQCPVRGRWLAINSPASKVPSHGVRAYGQSHAIDLVAEPNGEFRPAFGEGKAFIHPQKFPAFGKPVHAMVSGTVVSASSHHRDHRSRSTWLAFAYMMLAGSGRELGGPGFVVGNHVTIKTADGVFALVAHLKRDSLTVGPGDKVKAGQVIGECGNSGNSSEPHVHAQLMDRESLWTAQGLPMAFTGVLLGEASEPTDGLPPNDSHLVTS